MPLIDIFPSARKLRADNAALRELLRRSENEKASLHTKLIKTQSSLERRRRPARLAVDGTPEHVYEEALIGTESHPVLKAVIGLLNAKIVTMSDAATERPSPTIASTSGPILRGYSEEERLYDAGGCAQLAEFLARLQEAAKSKDSEEAASAA